jgi:hypothetical protein
LNVLLFFEFSDSFLLKNDQHGSIRSPAFMFVHGFTKELSSSLKALPANKQSIVIVVASVCVTGALAGGIVIGKKKK